MGELMTGGVEFVKMAWGGLGLPGSANDYTENSR